MTYVYLTTTYLTFLLVLVPAISINGTFISKKSNEHLYPPLPLAPCFTHLEKLFDPSYN